MDQLAEYLVGLGGQTSLHLTPQQETDIIELWEKLSDFDKRRVPYAAREQMKAHGRYRKKHSTVPNVEIATRSVLGPGGGPAQTPDCCRLVEDMIARLCFLHTSPVRKGQQSTSRWAVIMAAYRDIRHLVVSK